MLRKLLRIFLPSVFYFKDKDGKTIVANECLSIVKQSANALYSLNRYPDWDLHFIVEVNLLTGISLRRFNPILDGNELRWVEFDDDGAISLLSVIFYVVINIVAAIWFLVREFFYVTFSVVRFIYVVFRLSLSRLSFPIYILLTVCFYFWMDIVAYRSISRMRENDTYRKFMEVERDRRFVHAQIILVLLLLLYLWDKFYKA